MPLWSSPNKNSRCANVSNTYNIKLLQSFKDGFYWFCRSRDVCRALFSILSRYIRRSVLVWSCRDGLRTKYIRRASEIVMHCRCLMYVSTQYDDTSCRCLVAKPIIQLSERPSDVQHLRTLQLVCSCSWRLCILVVSELVHPVADLTYFFVM